MRSGDLRGSVGREFCPYRGLHPYTEEYRPFFFGRESDIDMIVANLLASRLSVLYGASGVGKSSVLLAGVQPLLRRTAGAVVVVFREWQTREFPHHLKTALLDEAGRVLGTRPDLMPGQTLHELIEEIHRRSQAPVSLILDQFEEYFVYHPDGDEAFEAELARAVNSRATDLHTMISLREEGLSSLDRFELRIPSILSNLLRLEHLDREGAAIAIRCPLLEYNRQRPPGLPRMTIDRPLVDAILRDEVHFEQSFSNVRPDAGGGSDRPIEMPFLQLVLTKLWETERADGSSKLRLGTFADQGGATGIVIRQLDSILSSLTSDEQAVAAKIFRHLVTPSGTKIAHSVSDLASNEDLPVEIVRTVATKLAAEGAWILREVTLPTDEEGHERYEVFHDAVTPAVLAWRRRFVARATEEARLKEERRAARKRLNTAYIFAGVAALLAIPTILVGVLRYRAADVQAIATTRVQQEKTARIGAEQRHDSLRTRFTRDSLSHVGETQQLSREIAQIQYRLRTVNSNLLALHLRFVTVDSQRARWQRAAQALEAGRNAVRDTLGNVRQQINTLTAAADSLNTRITHLQAELVEANTELAEANTRRTRAEDRATRAEGRVEQLEQRMADSSLIVGLRGELAEARREVARLNGVIRDLRQVSGDSTRYRR